MGRGGSGELHGTQQSGAHEEQLAAAAVAAVAVIVDELCYCWRMSTSQSLIIER
jgi:hypothetical protein